MRGLLALLVGPVLGQTMPHFPLYLVEALVVEARRAAGRDASARSRSARWSGLGIGTVGLAAEWAWTHVWMPLPWPPELFPRPRRWASAIAVAGGCSAPGSAPGCRPSRGRAAPALRSARPSRAGIAVAHRRRAGPSADRAAARGSRCTTSTPARTAPSGHRRADARARGRRRRLVRPSPPGRAAGRRRPAASRSAPASTGPPRRSPSTATGRRAAPAHAAAADRRADLPARGPGDPGGGSPRAARASTAGSSTRHSCCSASKTGGSPALVAIAYAAVAGIALSLLVLLTWSLHRLAFPPRPGLRRSRRTAANPTPALQR